MANDLKWEAPTVALTSLLTTTLNSLANGVIDVSAEVNNETNLTTFMDVEVTLASLNLSAQTNPSVHIYMFESVDGGTDFDTNEDGVSAASDLPTSDKIIAVLGLRIDTGAEAKTAVKSMIPIPPGRWKIGLRNGTGVTFGASGNVFAYRTYNLNSV